MSTKFTFGSWRFIYIFIIVFLTTAFVLSSYLPMFILINFSRLLNVWSSLLFPYKYFHYSKWFSRNVQLLYDRVVFNIYLLFPHFSVEYLCIGYEQIYLLLNFVSLLRSSYSLNEHSFRPSIALFRLLKAVHHVLRDICSLSLSSFSGFYIHSRISSVDMDISHLTFSTWLLVLLFLFIVSVIQLVSIDLGAT